MAGAIRQPIDLAALERYIDSHVKEIQVPISVKQVGLCQHSSKAHVLTTHGKIVRLWTIDPNVSAHGQDGEALRDAQEASRQAPVSNGAQGRKRVQDHSCP